MPLLPSLSSTTIVCLSCLPYLVLCCDVWSPSNPMIFYDTSVTTMCSYSELGITETPTDVYKTTELLDLTWNSLTVLDTDQLQHVTILKVINLKENQLTTFPNFKFCETSIEVINAPYNAITSLDLSILTSLQVLRVLILHSNDLHTVSPIPFGQTLPSISFIDVSFNDLQWFPRLCQVSHSPVYPDLQIILADNRLECGACFLWLKECPHRIVIDDASLQSKCITPTELKGELLNSLAVDELKVTACPVEFDGPPVLTSKNSVVYIKSSVWSGGPVILQLDSLSRTQCAMHCLRVKGGSFDYREGDKQCVVYAGQGGWYQERTQ